MRDEWACVEAASRHWAGTRTVAVAALVVAAVVAGCSGQGGGVPAGAPGASGAVATAPPATGPASPWPAAGAEVDETDAEAVADAVAVALSVRDTRTDATSTAAAARAARWYAPDLASTVPDGGTELARPPRRWSAMVARGAWDVVEDVDRVGDDPVDTPTTARRTRTVRVHATDASGWVGLVSTRRYWLTLVRTPEGVWRVSSLRIEDVSQEAG